MSDPARDEEDQALVDRLFAELVADYERTATAADRVDPRHTVPNRQPVDAQPADAQRADPRPADGGEVEAPAPDAYERYRPAPPPPWRRPGWLVLIGWSGVGWAVVATLLAVFGMPLPTWVGWSAVATFIGGFTLLISQLPRHRPPDAGDGAVL